MKNSMDEFNSRIEGIKNQWIWRTMEIAKSEHREKIDLTFESLYHWNPRRRGENFPNLAKDRDWEIQEAKQIQNKINKKYPQQKTS